MVHLFPGDQSDRLHSGSDRQFLTWVSHLEVHFNGNSIRMCHPSLSFLMASIRVVSKATADGS